MISQSIFTILSITYKIHSIMTSQQQRIVTWQQVGKHIFPSDCWVVVDGNAYNVTDFLVEHPGGDQVLNRWSGLDATEKFNEAKHSDYAVSLRNARFAGKLDKKEYPPGYEEKIKKIKKQQKKKKKPIVRITDPLTMQMVKGHQSEQNCWIVLQNSVYDVTTYLEEHPGGVGKIMQYAGKDATTAFQQAGHSLDAIKKKQEFLIGTIAKAPKHGMIALVSVFLVVLVGLVCMYY